MGIIYIPEKKYKCSVCGSEKYEQYTEPPKTKFSGHFEGIRCNDCGHEFRRYVKSIYEEEAGYDTVISYYKSNEPQKF